MASVPQPRIEAPPPAGKKLEETRRWVKRADKLARAVIVGGGLAVVLAVFLIIILIVAESLPLWKGASGRLESALAFPTVGSDPILTTLSDPYREIFVVLRASGVFQEVDRKTAKVTRSIPVPGAAGQRVTAVGRIASRDYLAVGFADGRAAVLSARLQVDFKPEGRVSRFDVRSAGEVQLLAAGTPVSSVAAVQEEWGNVLLGSSGGSDLILAKLPEPSEESDALPGAEAEKPSLEDLSPGSAARGSRASPWVRPDRKPSPQPPREPSCRFRSTATDRSRRPTSSPSSRKIPGRSPP